MGNKYRSKKTMEGVLPLNNVIKLEDHLKKQVETIGYINNKLNDSNLGREYTKAWIKLLSERVN